MTIDRAVRKPRGAMEPLHIHLANARACLNRGMARRRLSLISALGARGRYAGNTAVTDDCGPYCAAAAFR